MTREEAIDLLFESKDSDLRMSIREWEEWDKRFFEAIAMAIEALERKKGGWIDPIREKSQMFTCSVCRKIAYYPYHGKRKWGVRNKCEYNYCPNCGADMRGEEDG